MTYVNTEEMRRAAATADSAADSMRRSASTVEEAVSRIAKLFEPGFGGNGLRLIELFEEAESFLEPTPADHASWKARALEAENTVLKWEARATALDHANLDAILSALEDETHQAEQAAELALMRNSGLMLDFIQKLLRGEFPNPRIAALEFMDKTFAGNVLQPQRTAVAFTQEIPPCALISDALKAKQ